VLTFGGEGTGPGLFQEALRITADNDGNSYISDHTTTRIQRFDAAGKYKSGWTIGAEGGDPKAKYGPDELVADRLGNVYALFEGAILKYDAN
jgi:streptogramin lyase